MATCKESEVDKRWLFLAISFRRKMKVALNKHSVFFGLCIRKTIEWKNKYF
jgi:hypothetical protein